jgi:hypothetical protein
MAWPVPVTWPRRTRSRSRSSSGSGIFSPARAAHQLGHVPLQRRPGRIQQAGRLGDADLPERILGRLLPGVGGPDPAALVLHMGRVGTRRHADDRRGDGVGEDGAERNAVQRPGIDLLAGADAAGHVGEAQRPVRGDEGPVHHDVVAPRAAQPDRVPHVLDRVVARRQQERAEVGGLPKQAGWSSRKNPVSASALTDSADSTRRSSASWARCRKAGSTSVTPAITA